jgi:phosphomannomutase/phosphoglucomutase
MLKLSRGKHKDAVNGKPAANGKSQAVTARGNALRRLGGAALLTALLPLLAGFAYLMLVREPLLQARQADRVVSSFATQQATSLYHFQAQFRERLRGAARSEAALAVIAGAADANDVPLEQSILDFFPEAVSLHILPIGDMGTAAFAEGNQGLRNHIELDLVRRASEGEATQPESFQFEGQWLTSFAELVTHTNLPGRRGVVIASIDNQLLSSQLIPVERNVGKFDLEQVFDPGNSATPARVVASTGSGDATGAMRRAAVPESAWQVAFTPSNTFMESLTLSPWPLLSVLALSMLGALAGLWSLIAGFSRVLAAEADKLIAAADNKTPLELEVPELVPVAKQLRRATQRGTRHQRASPPPDTPPAQATGGELTNPMFQSGSMLDESRDEEVLELDIAEELALDLSADDDVDGFPSHIFRAYDIRGIADTELTDEMVTNIGKAIGSLAKEKNEQTLVVGCDGRASSGRIKASLIRALVESGRDVIDIGMVPTPLLYFATRHLPCNSGVMVTGSHNPAEFNGLKIVIGQQTIAAGGIQDIRERVRSGKFSSGQGRVAREDIVPAYIEEVVGDIAIAVPLKIVIDAGNGATSEIAPALFDELGCEVVPLYCQVDGHFPNHPPDTSDENNLTDLVREVREQGADFGVAFDGDGDRLAVVTASGKIVRSDVLLMIYAEDVVSRNPGADVVFDVKCSRNLTQLITHHGGRPVLWKTGHAFMKEKMAETGALLGGEFSGHMFFGERWYGFDDGMYAAGRLAEILSTHDRSLDEAIADFPVTVNTAEILIPIDDAEKFEAMASIINSADFPAGKINTLDGLRVDFTDGWGLIRASNTSAALTARFEATTDDNLATIMQAFSTQIGLAEPDLKLPF